MFSSLFQTFTETSDPGRVAERVARLREELAERGLDGFIVPRADEHQNEYVPPHAERLAWLTGFSGSAGLAVVLKDRAAIFVDGRYTVQIRNQTDTSVFAPEHLIDAPPEQWLAAHAAEGAKIGFDPWLHTAGAARRYREALAGVKAELIAVEDNPIDAIWADRPEPPLGAVSLYPASKAGEKAQSKIARALKVVSTQALLVSDPHNVAWLFNIRGADVGHTPLPLAYALLSDTGNPILYIDGRKLSNAVRDHLSNLADIEEPSQLDAAMTALGRSGASVRFEASTAPVRLVEALEKAGGKADVGTDPIALMKAVKNRAELSGSRAAHLRDGAAMARFLAWFDEEAPKGKLTEIDAAEALETFRRETGKLKDISFPSISAAGPNAALPHYRVTQSTNRKIGKGIFLIDSGAQYEDGTTDITRTIAVGKPIAEMRDRYTRVLQGHIAIATAVFPHGTSGAQLDVFARRALWQAGVDFDHGTGHGIGAYLSVHEGPQRIAKTGTVPLVEGMILSNEPGYYKEGAFGIRIENLIIVEKRTIAGGERPMLGFETVTLAPIDTRLIEARLMTRAEVNWLNVYHGRVRKALAPLVDARTKRWLNAATKTI